MPSSEPSAAAPTTLRPRPKNCRRVSATRVSSEGSETGASCSSFDGYLFSASSRFRSWFATIVNAASCAREGWVGLALADREKCRRASRVRGELTSRSTCVCTTIARSAGVSGRISTRRARRSIAASEVPPPSFNACCASCRAASINCGSFSVDQRLQRRIRPLAAHGARLAAGRVEDVHRAGGAVRFQNV